MIQVQEYENGEAVWETKKQEAFLCGMVLLR